MESKYVNMFMSGLVDGAIFACLTDVNNELIMELARNYIPIVYVDRLSEDEQVIPVIKSDLRMARTN